MGYGVYEDPWHYGRWSGYMVWAECDWPDCHVEIDHGMAYLCEEHVTYISEDENGEELDEEREEIKDGCKLYFCDEHMHKVSEHADVQPKPDHPKWSWWILNHGSWDRWRAENPDKVAWHQENAKDFHPDAELLEEVESH